MRLLKPKKVYVVTTQSEDALCKHFLVEGAFKNRDLAVEFIKTEYPHAWEFATYCYHDNSEWKQSRLYREIEIHELEVK